MKSFKIIYLSAAMLIAGAVSAQSGLQTGSGTSVPVQGTPSNAGSNRHNRGVEPGTNTSATIADDNSTGKAPLISDEPDRNKAVSPTRTSTDTVRAKTGTGSNPKR